MRPILLAFLLFGGILAIEDTHFLQQTTATVPVSFSSSLTCEACVLGGFVFGSKGTINSAAEQKPIHFAHYCKNPNFPHHSPLYLEDYTNSAGTPLSGLLLVEIPTQ
jgi:hypothetical protein